jgi:hypothetical protein
VITKLPPQRLLGLEFGKKGVQHPWATQPLLQLRDGNVRCRRRGAGRRRPGVVRWSLRHHAAVKTHHQHLEHALGGWPG